MNWCSSVVDHLTDCTHWEWDVNVLFTSEPSEIWTEYRNLSPQFLQCQDYVSPYDVSEWVCCSWFLLITNLTHFFQCIYLFPFSTCFEQPSAHHRENRTVSICHLVYITLCRWLICPTPGLCWWYRYNSEIPGGIKGPFYHLKEQLEKWAYR